MDTTQQLAEIIKTTGNIVFFGGAGVSTESGIPDFRSENGSFAALKKYKQPPEVLLSRSFFERHPEVFFEYYKASVVCPGARPKAAHIALAKLEQMGKLKALITQNIDGLHQMADSKNVLELHGSVLRNYCVGCGARYELGYILNPANCSAAGVPRCAACGGVVRPDVMLYEEALDQSILERAAAAIRRADAMIVGGTSLVVYPAAGLLRYFSGDNLVLINRSKTPFDNEASLVIHDSIGLVLSRALAALEA